MRSTYRVLAILIAVVVVLQAASIAFAWFDVLHAVDDGKAFTDIDDRNAGHDMHSLGAIVIAVLALLLLIVSFFARIPGGVKWALIVFGVMLLQWVLAIVAFSVARDRLPARDQRPRSSPASPAERPAWRRRRTPRRRPLRLPPDRTGTD